MEDSSNGLFTPRQIQVLTLWASTNLSKKGIGDEIGFGKDCVDYEIRVIYTKLGVRTRQGAVHQAWLRGIFKREDFL